MPDFVFDLYAPSTSVVIGVTPPDVVLSLGTFLRGETGPAGPGGPGAGAVQSVIANAGAALGGHRMVGANSAGDYTYVGPNVLLDALRAVGMTTGAAALGAPVTVQTRGPITEPTWAWTPDQPIYLAANGLLTQTAPLAASGAIFQMVVGVALTPTSMYVQLSPPLFL